MEKMLSRRERLLFAILLFVMVTGAGTLLGPILSKSIENVKYSENYPGATIDVRIANCIADLPATGPATCNATNDTTGLSFSGNLTISRSGTTLLMPQAKLLMGSFSILVTGGTNNIRISGPTPWGSDLVGNLNGCYLKYTGTGTAVSMGDSSATSFNHYFGDCTIDIITAGTSAIAFSTTRVYHQEITRPRIMGTIAATSQIGILNDGSSTAPGSQNMLTYFPSIQNVCTGMKAIGGTTPPLNNMNQLIGGEITGPGTGLAGCIGIDIEAGTDHWMYGAVVAFYDTGLKVNSPSGMAVQGDIHIEQCGTQGILFTGIAVNNQLRSDTSCPITDTTLANQNTVHGVGGGAGNDYFYGGIVALGTSTLNRLFNSLEIRGKNTLPNNTSGTMYMAGGYTSPILGKIYVGDGTGWQLNLSKRNGGTDTELFQFKDSGNMSASGSVTAGPGGLVSNNSAALTLQNLLISSSNPTISSGFGTSPSIVGSNGPASFTVNVGTGGTATNGTIGLPTASGGWNCTATDLSTTSATVFMTKQTGGTTSTAAFSNFNNSGVNAAWAASDVLQISCFAR